jgi:inorganic triphosphatase YgiF
MCRILKNDPLFENIPVFVQVLNSDALEIKRAFLSGARDILPYDFEAPELFYRLSKALSHATRQLKSAGSQSLMSLSEAERLIRFLKRLSNRQEVPFTLALVGLQPDQVLARPLWQLLKQTIRQEDILCHFAEDRYLLAFYGANPSEVGIKLQGMIDTVEREGATLSHVVERIDDRSLNVTFQRLAERFSQVQNR